MRLQCLENCGQPVWNFSDSKDHAFEICSDTLTCLSPLPKCPRCESLARPNILMFSDFYWDCSIHSTQEKQLYQWLQRHGTENLFVIEFGAGLDVPTVRYFCESPKIDRAIAKYGGIQQFLRQKFDLLSTRAQAFDELTKVLK